VTNLALLSTKNKNFAFLLIGLSSLASAFALLSTNNGAEIVSILKSIGIYNPPSWLVYSLMAAGATSLIVSILVTGGWIAAVPGWAQAALLSASSYSL